MSNGKIKFWLKDELELRGIKTSRTGAKGDMKIPNCWDSDCNGDDCSLNIYTGLWQCYSHKGNDSTRKGNIVQGFAIRDGKGEGEVWHELKSRYADFNEPKPFSAKDGIPKRKEFSYIPQKYIDDCVTSLHDKDLGKVLLEGLIQRQALTYETVDAAQLGFDPREKNGNGRYIIPVFNKDGNVINAKRYDPSAGKYKYLYYTEDKKKFKTIALYPQVLIGEKDVRRQLLYSYLVIVEGMFSALCLIPFLNPMGVGVVCNIGGANSNSWLRDPEIRHQLAGKRILILFDVDKTGIENGKLAARMLKHRDENTVFLGNLWDVISIYTEHGEKFVYGASKSDPNPDDKIMNADPVDWVKYEAERLNVPLTGKDLNFHIVKKIQEKFAYLWDEAVEQEDDATFTDEDGDLIVKPDELYEIAKLYLEKVHSEKDFYTLRHNFGKFRKQKKDGVAFNEWKAGFLKRSITKFCKTLKNFDREGNKVAFIFNDRTVDSLAKFVEWEIVIEDKDKAFLIDPKLSLEFPDDIEKNVQVMNTEYINIEKFLKTGNLDDIDIIPKTGNFYTPYERNFDWQIKVEGEKIIKAVKELWWPEDLQSQEFFWEMMGYINYFGNPLQKIFYIWGNPGCGRSDLLHIATYQVGKKRSWPARLSNLKSQFAAGMLPHKALITFADVNLAKQKFGDGEIIAENLKNWSGGDDIPAMEKYKMEISEIIYANMILTSNVIITLPDASPALMDRFRMLKLYRPFRGELATEKYRKERKDHFWKQIVYDQREMVTIYKEGLIRLPSLLERKDFNEPENCATGRNILEVRSNTNTGFFKNACIFEIGNKNLWITKGDFETGYGNYATKNNFPEYERLGKIKLGEALIEFNPQVDGEGTETINGKKARVWRFVSIDQEYLPKTGRQAPTNNPHISKNDNF